MAKKAFDDQVALCDAIGASRDVISISLTKMQGLGSCGRLAGNVNRDLINWLGEPKLVGTSMFEVSIKLTKETKLRMVPRLPKSRIQTFQDEFLLPHLAFAYMYRHQAEQFLERFLGPTEGRACRLEDFWNTVEASGDPRLTNHPMTRQVGWKKRAIPLPIHGDAVPVIRIGRQGSSSMECLSFQSLLAEGATLKCKMLMHAMFEDSKVGDKQHGTMATVWGVLSWSFKSLFEGVSQG